MRATFLNNLRFAAPRNGEKRVSSEQIVAPPVI